MFHYFSKIKHMPPPPHPQIQIYLLNGIFYTMLHECVHSCGISCIYRQGSMDFVELYFQLPGIMHVVMGLCYNSVISIAILISYTISYEIMYIALDMFYCDSHILIHIIYLVLRHSWRSVLVLAIHLAMLTNSPQ